MLHDLAGAENRVVGLKQTLKAIHDDAVLTVYLAQDVDGFVYNKIVTACQGKGVTPVLIATMSELGSACGIDIGAATAAIVEPSRMNTRKNG